MFLILAVGFVDENLFNLYLSVYKYAETLFMQKQNKRIFFFKEFISQLTRFQKSWRKKVLKDLNSPGKDI